MATPRNPAIDVIKGGLMLLVMLGHLSGAGVEDSFFKWMLYGFHMPMFMALSGYLVPVERLRDEGLAATLGRYWWRMILPWAVVFVVAQPLVGDWRHVAGWVNALVHPWNHLWFVPVLTAFLVLGVVVPLSRLWLFVAALALGGPMWFAPQLFGIGWGAFPFDVRYLTMAPFFFGGLWLRRADVRIGWWIASVFLVALGLWGFTFKAPHSPWLAIYPVMTLSSVALIPWLERLPLRGPVIEVIGAESLFFYLHHPWLFNIARRTLYRWLDWPLAYGVTLVLSIAILLAVRPLLARVRPAALLVGLAPVSRANP